MLSQVFKDDLSRNIFAWNVIAEWPTTVFIKTMRNDLSIGIHYAVLIEWHVRVCAFNNLEPSVSRSHQMAQVITHPPRTSFRC